MVEWVISGLMGVFVSILIMLPIALIYYRHNKALAEKAKKVKARKRRETYVKCKIELDRMGY